MITIRKFTDEHVDAVKANSFEDIKNCTRLFYELVVDYNKKTGFFKEIKDVPSFIELDEHHQKNGINGNCSNLDYINHHNFHVISAKKE